MSAEREMTLQEWVERLPKSHTARQEYDRICDELAKRDTQNPFAWHRGGKAHEMIFADDWSDVNNPPGPEKDWEPVYKRPPAPDAVPDWHAITEAVEEMVDHYEYRGGEGDYTPTETERVLIQDAAMGVLDTIAPMLQSAEPASIEIKTAADDMEYMPEGAVDFRGEPASRSESDNQNEGLEAFDELMRNVLFLNVHERSKLERIVRKHLCESRDDVKAEALEEFAGRVDEAAERDDRAERKLYLRMARVIRAEAARLRGEGEES